ncbi:C4-dicarboxylate transport sensor protein DctB [Halomonas elongata]|uniref:histidine kinase n=1 Tax=Halomonas elongata TaxID=2746 RepID=A0A1B8NYZ2_HALEL|nr:cache domain-containing protein [Halomonas elongata]OBX35209.1 C4-dicarboxylate transport sensor protein DctB [Halomonas elongata]
MLNRNLDFIDTINDLVYRDRSLPEGSQGTATLFLDDVRVSTNVRLFEGARALGTRVSAEVRSQVLERGEVWLDRAFVVNDWYISAYEPIVDSHGERVGMLYVGFLEAPFRQARISSIILIAVIFLAITAISVPIFLRWARRIFRPLERMNDTIGRVESGDLGARIGTGGGRGEISRVARHLDDLLDQVQERDRRLRDWAGELNDKVEERTRDLQEANRRLERTTEQLVMSEKLAAVGEITAGVAHEINNPVAVIQGNLDVARQSLGSRVDEVATEFDLIDDQVHRISAIISKLLQFARPANSRARPIAWCLPR